LKKQVRHTVGNKMEVVATHKCKAKNTLVGKAWEIRLLAQPPIWIDPEQTPRD
jgi:uncharacterized Fe-S cluster protein YjdI